MRAFNAISQYGLYGEVMDTDDQQTQVIIELVRELIDKSRNKGGRPKKEEQVKEPPKEEKEPKEKHGDFVELTNEEYLKLGNVLGDKREAYIEKVNNYIGMSGKKYKSHYHAILKFSEEERKQLKAKEIPKQEYKEPVLEDLIFPR